VVPRDQIEKQAASLVLAGWDVDAAINTVDLLLEDGELAIAESAGTGSVRLAEMAVVMYARPFTKGPWRLNNEEWPGYTWWEWRWRHKRFIELRNDFLAHGNVAGELQIAAGDEDDWRASFGRSILTLGEMPDARKMFDDLRVRLKAATEAAIKDLVADEYAKTGTWPVGIVVKRPR
jgi:hypothetical protein